MTTGPPPRPPGQPASWAEIHPFTRLLLLGLALALVALAVGAAVLAVDRVLHPGPTYRCRDGATFDGYPRQGSCSWHGGVG